MPAKNKVCLIILLFLSFGILSCNSDKAKENPNLEEIDYKLRIHKSAKSGSLRSADLKNLNLNDRILFYHKKEPFPEMTKNQVDQFYNPNIDYIIVEANCFIENKDYYQRFQIKEARFYFYQIVPEELLLWPNKDIACDFVFHPHFLSGSTNAIQKSFVLNLESSITYPDIKEKSLISFQPIELKNDHRQKIEKICLDKEYKLIKSKPFEVNHLNLPLGEEVSCRYWIYQKGQTLLSPLLLNQDFPLVKLNFANLSHEVSKPGGVDLFIENIGSKTLAFKIPVFIGKMRRHLHHPMTDRKIRTAMTYDAKVLSASYHFEKKGDFYHLLLEPGEIGKLRLGSHCVSVFEQMGNYKAMASDYQLHSNWLEFRFYGSEDEKYYPLNLSVNGIDMQALANSNNANMYGGRHTGHMKVNRNCQHQYER